ncbi:MAG TPA: protein-disulfide reductase DsbD domain-containing protein [Actinomycetota bacterium]|nr:protein-disulfide reductase DsbD domain-containing protein [Actinomycetota bacterium]
MNGPAVGVANWLGLRARVKPATLRPGKRGRIVVEVTVPEGGHVESHEPGEPWLIPTVLRVEVPPGLSVGDVEYPPAEERTFDWSPAALRVYRGTFELSAPLEADRSAPPGRVALVARVGYQGCTEALCLMPSEQAAEAWMEIVTE